MIDRLQRAAQALQFLRVPTIALGLVSLAVLLVLMFTSPSHDSDRFLIPGILGLLWSLSAYAFITTFCSVPGKACQSARFFARVRRAMVRAGYSLVAVVFIGMTLAVGWVTFRMILVWLKDYGG